MAYEQKRSNKKRGRIPQDIKFRGIHRIAPRDEKGKPFDLVRLDKKNQRLMFRKKADETSV